MDAPGVPEPQRLCSSAETQTSFLCNPFQEVTRVEISTQTQPPEEFDSDDIQRMLQLLEKSSQLSPELAELLTDHFSSRKATKENESPELSRSVNAEKDCATSASKHKAQCLIHPLNSTVSPSPPISVSENHDVDSTVQTTSLPHTSDLSCPLDGMEPSFRGPSLHGKEGRMSTTKQIRPTKQDDTSTGLNIVQKVRVASKETECSAGVSSVDATDTSSSCAATGKIADIDGGPSGDSMDTRRDFQGTAVGSSSKIVFLKMLEIDKEIQKLMEVKVELYKKLHPSLEIDFPCTDRNSSHSPKSRGLQYANPTTEASSDTVCNRVMLSSNHNTQQMHMGLLTVNNNDPTGSSFTSDRLTPTSTPMVMLPIHYVLGSSAELQNTHLSVPRQKLGECLKTFDTSVVEAVLNSFNLPDCRSRGGDAAVAHSSDHENQNKMLGDVGEATPLKSKSGHLDGNNANKGRRHLAPHFSTHEESHQSETNSSLPEAVSLKIQVSEPKLNVSRQRYYGKKKKKSHVQHKTGIATNKMSSRSVGQENSGIGGNSDAIAGKPIQSDSLMQTGGDELQNRRQAYSCESKHQKENLSRCRSTRHKVKNMNHEKESSQSDSSSVVQDRKETHSSVKTKVPTKDDKQSVTDCSPSSKRPTRHSQRMFCQADNSFCRSRRNTRSGSHSDVEVQLQEATEIVKNRERTRSSKGRNSISLHESDSESDSVSTVPCKRKVTEILDRSSQDELSKPATQSRSRRSCIRIASNFQDMQPTVMHGNATEMSTKVKTVKVGQTVDVDESAVSARQLRRIQNSNNHDTFLSSEVLNSGLSFESFPSSRSRRHGGGTQKRRPDELEGPPNKVQRLGPKLDLLQWKLQDCFVKVKPLAIETVAHSLPSEELTTTDSVGDQRIRTFSSSSDELSVVEFVGKHKKERDRKEQAQVEGSSNEQDHLGGIPDTFSCQSQPADLRIRPCGNDPSSPVHLSHDLMQSDLPIQLQGHCTLRDVVTQDENSLSTLLSDVLSVTSDGDQSAAKRSGNGDGSERDLQLIADDKDECDRDSTCSYDTPQEGREGTESKHKLSKKHKKDPKPDGIERLVFESHKGPILDIKTVGRHMLAASEDGSVYCYSLKSGKFKRKYEGHNAAVTCLCVIECSNNGVSTELEAASEEQMAPDLFFTGSLDKHLRNFRFKTGELVHNPVNVRSPIQCMDQNWGIVFIGTQTGEVVRFNIKTSSLIGEPMKIDRESVLSLRATKEGARQVLIIGSRNKPITVRDAATGLLLRTVCNSWSHTVYSSVLSSGLVYFGTKTGIIPVVEFTTGDEVCRFKTASGVVCMRIYNNLLFAGCYDGNIYVFSIHDKKLVTSIPGPGKMLLCMDIVKNRIIAGIKDNNKLEAWAFPQELRCHLKEAKHR
ncbi:hypothetical protein L798_12973 [Zootermopsis nevadensis]|uniref:Zinc finger protein 106 n=2 Tax=Zootermopsis nevadensis TaxID=136037 RepID=A0A067QTW3_ZOONE|nr:hypothetical protein L798_12973 [Zootermopsis nevadensis]